ncbi:MAG: hypothetical protein H7312_15520 [Tardiphaga sp.]|nr:hypothetical protein [Tardiphaga sp.]
MKKPQPSHVNLKSFGEFNKYIMGLGAAAFLYFDKFELSGYAAIRTAGTVFSALAVIIGIITMSALGRIHGEEIDYELEKDHSKLFLFKFVSRALVVELIALLFAMVLAGSLSLIKIWK